MKRWISIALLFAASCAGAPPGMAPPDAIDAEVRRLMASEDVVGLALAIIDDGEVAHVAAYGVRDLARSRPLILTRSCTPPRRQDGVRLHRPAACG
jgi:CubicO group peptidase (beta-lactamase class C family)